RRRRGTRRWRRSALRPRRRSRILRQDQAAPARARRLRLGAGRNLRRVLLAARAERDHVAVLVAAAVVAGVVVALAAQLAHEVRRDVARLLLGILRGFARQDDLRARGRGSDRHGCEEGDEEEVRSSSHGTRYPDVALPRGGEQDTRSPCPFLPESRASCPRPPRSCAPWASRSPWSASRTSATGRRA